MQLNEKLKKSDDTKRREAELVDKTLSEPPLPTRLGEWEKYTNVRLLSLYYSIHLPVN